MQLIVLNKKEKSVVCKNKYTCLTCEDKLNWRKICSKRFILTRNFFVLSVAFLLNIAFAQSVEVGQAFNKFMSAEEGINPLSGSAALKKNLATISSGKASISLELSYSGNVEDIVKNRNDIAPTSWTGLGWTLGHAKITCDNAQTMWTGDDSYYLETSAGVRYKIVKGTDTQNSKLSKWWVESLPYWSILPDTKNVVFGSNSYTIIVGWKLVDDSGIAYYYGDGDYDAEKPIRNATEYTIANPYSNGIVGVYENGHDALFPNAWNLQKIVDLEGNFLIFSYTQYLEHVKKRYPEATFPTTNWHNYKTKSAYTKECYLTSIKSSQGAEIQLITKAKDYTNEFLDTKGLPELDENADIDAYIDPIERRFLSQIIVTSSGKRKIKDAEGQEIETGIVKYIDFCYKPLNVQIDGSINSKYVKRLLTSVVETDVRGEEIQKELYFYHEKDFDESTNTLKPIGAIDSIKGSDCGVVRYVYKDYGVIQVDQTSGLHKDVLPVIKASIGNLEDGTAYLAGLDTKNKKVLVYFRKNGSWKLQQTLTDIQDVAYESEGYFIVGDKNWFIYVEDGSNTKFHAFLWTGEKWEKEKTVTDYGSYDKVEVGPGYILRAHIANKKVNVKMEWSAWGGTFESDDYKADDDKDDRQYVQMSASKNHFSLFYKDQSWGNSGHLKIFSFGANKNVIESFDVDDLDDDNRYSFVDDNILVGVTEGSGINGYYAKAYHWREDGKKKGFWYRYDIDDLKGWQGAATIQSMGDAYFVVRHNDYDNMSLFDYDGEKWTTIYDNENMVHHQDFDPKTEAEWDAVSGYNFFVARRPRIKKHWYGNEIKPFREYEKIERVDGVWKRGDNVNPCDDKKNIYAGSDWYIVKQCEMAHIRNGYNWIDNEEFIFNSEDPKIYKSLNGDFFVYELANFSQTIVYYKKDNSFKNGHSAFFVVEKIVEDPVSDKITKYSYTYHPYVVNNSESSSPIYDFVTKAPFVGAYYITLPDNAGIIEKILCNYGDGTAHGEICKENFYEHSNIYPVEKIEKEYKRHRENRWPGYIYADQLVSVKQTNRNISREQVYTYADEVNGLVQSVVLKDGGTPLHEQINIYAVEKYPELANAGRLTEKIGSYKCEPTCSEGVITEGAVVTYANLLSSSSKNSSSSSKETNLQIKDEWAYTPKNTRDSKFSFDWSSSSFSSWTKLRTMSNYYRGVARETVNQYGVNASIVYDKGTSGRVHAKVQNAKLDEILIFTDTCEMENLICNDVSLNGRYFEESGSVSKNGYGRFSQRVAKITQNQKFEGIIPKAKKQKYRFSAWAQSTSHNQNSDKLNISLSSLSASFALKGNGNWEYVEWETPDKLNSTQYKLTLSTLEDTEIHLQDVRFVPIDAVVETFYWDRCWNLSIAKSNDRGVGTYTVYDNNGRIEKIFGETEDGDVVLRSKKTYISGSCALPTNQTALKKLEINGTDIPITSNPGEFQIYVDNNTDELNVSWETMVAGEKVFYTLYKDGIFEDFKEDCCASSMSLSKDFEGEKMILQIAASAINHPYKVEIMKSTTGWIDYGHYFENGYSPVYGSNKNVASVFYLTDDKIRRQYYESSAWKEDSESRTGDFQVINSTVNNNVNHIIALPDNRNQFTVSSSNGLTMDQNALAYDVSSVWSNRGAFEGVGVESDKYQIETSQNNVSYLVYEKTNYTLVDYDVSTFGDAKKSGSVESSIITDNSSIVAKKLIGNDWTDLGEVALGHSEDLALTVGSNDIPMVAYIGKSASAKMQQTLYDKNEDDDHDNHDEINDPPSQYKYSYTFEPNVVIVKHLTTSNGQNKWIGYGSEDGDILKDSHGNMILNAKRIRIASDGSVAYLAVLYDDSDETNAIAAGVSENVLKVFKLENTNSQLNFVELTDYFVNSSVIARLNENNHFELNVYNQTPYLSFDNEENKNMISVLMYNGSRWLSVGKPAFAAISDQKNSVDFAMYNGIPYVVFKESANSSNINRQNKIVPMRYSVNEDKNLTLSSIGNSTTSPIASDFRQYILNYRTNVSENVSSITFDLSFVNQYDVSAVCVENNGVFIYQGANSTRSVNVPLLNGMNEIKIIISGNGVAPLTYTFIVKKEYEPTFYLDATISGTDNVVYSLLTSSTSSMISTSTSSGLNSSNSTITSSSSSSKDVLTYGIQLTGDETKTKFICLDFPSTYFMVLFNRIFSTNVCLEYDFEKQTFVLSSSSEEYWSVSSSSDVGSGTGGISSSSDAGSGNQVYFTDGHGHDKIVEIIVLYSSSSFGTSYINISSSSIPEISSSSSSVQFDEEFGEIIPETVVPSVYAMLYTYKFVGVSSISFANTVYANQGDYLSNYVEVAADAKIYGKLISLGNILLNSNAYAESISLGGVYNSQLGAKYGSMDNKIPEMPEFVTKTFTAGNTNVNVWSGQVHKFYPGTYGDVNIYANSKVSFEPGAYYFRSLYVAPDVSLAFENASRPVQIWVQNNISIGDRTNIENKSNAQNLFIYGNGSSPFYIGVQTNISATVAYPNGNVNLSPYTVFTGSVWAKSITIGANSSIK